MFLFFSRKKRAEEEKQAQHTWGPCTLASRQYEILHLVVIQSWTHLVLYGKSSGGVEIFTRRIMKFCGVFSSCKIRCIPRQRCETRSSWYSGVKADIVHHQREGGIDKVLFRIFSVYFPYISSCTHALLLFSAFSRDRGLFRNRVDCSHSGISHQALPLQPLFSQWVLRLATLGVGAFCFAQ